MEEVYVPQYVELLEKLEALVIEWKDVSMLARTHGQPASPTRLGKEIDVFVTRLKEQFKVLNKIPNAAKFGGATGNYNAHKVAYPIIDWKELGIKKEQARLRSPNIDGLQNYNTFEIDKTIPINRNSGLILILD